MPCFQATWDKITQLMCMLDDLSMKVLTLLYFGIGRQVERAQVEITYQTCSGCAAPSYIHVQDARHPHACSGCAAPSCMFRMRSTLMHVQDAQHPHACSGCMAPSCNLKEDSEV